MKKISNFLRLAFIFTVIVFLVLDVGLEPLMSNESLIPLLVTLGAVVFIIFSNKNKKPISQISEEEKKDVNIGALFNS